MFSVLYLCTDDISHIHLLCEDWRLISPRSLPYSQRPVPVFNCFSSTSSLSLFLLRSVSFNTYTPSSLCLSSCSFLLHHLNSVIMQRSASFAVWQAARHSGSLLAGWLIPVYLAPLELAVITELRVMNAVGLGLCCFAGWKVIELIQCKRLGGVGV